MLYPISFLGGIVMGEVNNDLNHEQERIQFVVDQISKKQEKLIEHTGGLKGDIIDIRKNFWEDITVNLDEPDDIIETQTSIKQQAEMLAERERSHGQYYKEMKTLQRLKDSPYFGRIDFLEEGTSNTEKIYIGIASLMDERDEDFLIYDWRAPISSLYYDYSPGIAQYDTPEGIIHGEMVLKRQYIIRNSLIKSMFDTGITIGDEMLQEVLGHHADNQMKSIVATIQKEQNMIIRNQGSKYLVVQGVAGSGKTSAALQRVAYLLYRYRKTLNANNIVLFSPNPLFNSYVSTVLPELGEENMQQTTFQEYLETNLKEHFQLEDPFNQIEFALSPSLGTAYESRMSGIRYKATMAFKTLIDQYLNKLGRDGLRFRNITFKGTTLVTSKEIKTYFYELDDSQTISNRMDEVREWLLKRLRRLEREERNKEWVEEEISFLDKADYVQVYQDIQEKDGYTESSFDDYEREEKLLKKIVVNRYFKSIKKKVKQLEFINTQLTYHNMFMHDWKHDQAISLPENWANICSVTMEALKQGLLYYEDATPYLYFLEQIKGKKANLAIRHLFIDEAQDYTPFQMAYLKELFPKSKMTILGDFNQAIYPHTVNLKTLVSDELYNEDELEKMELTRSYRSTKEIVDFTRSLVEGGESIEPFNRHGEKPTLLSVDDEEKHLYKILSRLQSLEAKEYQTVAVICKTATESERAYHQLKSHVPVQLMTKETGAFKKGILVLPAYLAKGIEFDAVIIFNASSKQYQSEDERKLFYTAATRAMHELHLFALGAITPYLNHVPESTYSVLE